MSSLDSVFPVVTEGEQQMILDMYRHLRPCWQSIQRSTTLSVDQGSSNSIGRPRLLFSLDLVELLHGAGYKVAEICYFLGVSRTTLWRVLKESNVSLQRFTDISDVNLDRIILAFKTNHPHCGFSMVQGHLSTISIKVPRRRIRESLQRIDLLGVQHQWHEAIHRRVYRVPGPNSLWHIDGHHSLIRWRMVIHGGIDGYSRMIVFLHSSTNNQSETVFSLFPEAIEMFNVPSRVRSDKGGENVCVCEFMIAYRGLARASHIAGASVHNQRIER